MALTKKKRYARTKFTPEVLREALSRLGPKEKMRPVSMDVEAANEAGWSFDEMDEFFAAYRAADTVSAELNFQELAGHIADVLDIMEDEASFAILVMTGENEDHKGELHARENVIHEVGLFQGRLGFRRAIVLLEDGCAEFSNLAGVQYIPFAKGNIRETFGEILATIRREFNPEGG
ncbi:hypothetical protein ABIE89_009099 [Bradyrhizobium niftali]|uniref:TIR domain-containing protein n=1 Tax=Bradyrhizobium niftali TaxID=2560055 RepID=UPI0038375BF8